MKPYFADESVTLFHGDALADVLGADVLGYPHRLGYHPPLIPNASVDAVITDPPYGLEFMGREWDSFKPGGKRPTIGEADGSPHRRNTGTPSWAASGNPVCRNCGGTKYDRTRPSGCRCSAPDFPNEAAAHMRAFQQWCEAWARESLRVLKPGGYLLAFGGTRTVHRLTCAIEDAGFEIRDGIDWLYASGFPKSLDVSKAIDRRRDDREDALAVAAWLTAVRDRAGWTNQQIDALFGFSGMAGHWTARPDMKICHVPTWEQWTRLREAIGFGGEMDAEVWRLNGRKGQPGEAWHDRKVIGERTTGRGTGRGAVAYIGDSENKDVTAPATEDARRWAGWGTALKPAREPIVVARRPLSGTVAANVLTHGTGGLNIDACRTAAGQDYRDKWTGVREDSSNPAGRWPTNVVLSHAAAPDGVDLCAGGCVDGCPVAELDRQSGVTVSSDRPRRNAALVGSVYGAQTERVTTGLADSGGASRFFPVFRYEPKAPTAERPRDGQTAHPTVKPLDLMCWLVRLVTPPKGKVLDLFAGSGTTGEACVIEGFECVLVEREAAYLPLIVARLSKPLQPALDIFGEAS